MSAAGGRPEESGAGRGPAAALRAAVPWIGLLARLGLAFVWAYAGWEKALDPGQAAYAVRGYDVLPENLVEPVGYALPYLELGLALLLVAGLGTRLVAAISAVLLLVFIAGIAQAWARGLAIDCGCFGGGGPVAPDKTAYLEEILRDCGFLLIAGWLIVLPRSRFAADGWLFPPEPPIPSSGNFDDASDDDYDDYDDELDGYDESDDGSGGAGDRDGAAAPGTGRGAGETRGSTAGGGPNGPCVAPQRTGHSGNREWKGPEVK